MATLNFDTEGVEPAGPIEAFPPGDYPLEVVDTDLKPTKAGDGEYLAVTFEVADGQYKGRKVFENFNLSNPNAEAERIAKSQFAALCLAVGRPRVGDSIELHGLRFVGSVGVEKRKDNGEMKNRMRGYKPLGSAATAAPKPAAGAKGPMPWAKTA